MSEQPLKPDFNSTVTTQVSLPFSEKPFIKVSFNDPMLTGYEVIVIADTTAKAKENNRLTTIVARFPRCVLSEVNTHRVFSRNSASSRAKSVKTTIRDVMNDPYIPLFTKNQRGMSGESLTANERELAIKKYLRARDSAVYHELSLLLGNKFTPGHQSHSEAAANWEHWMDIYYNEVYGEDKENEPGVLNIHKQNANRLIEPYSWHEAIITSTYWDNFIELRDHDEAQGEIHAFGRLVKVALQESLPQQNWAHIPFIDNIPENNGLTYETLREMLVISGSECAKISYNDVSKSSTTVKNTDLGERLLKMRHMSPFEHAGIDMTELDREIFNVPKETPAHLLSANFSEAWAQSRILLSGDQPR